VATDHVDRAATAFTRPIDVAAGDLIHADYGPLGAINL